MDMIGLIEKELSKKAEIEFLPMQPGDIEESFAEIKFASEKLSFYPNVRISEGIPKFISWYKQFYNLK